MSLPPNNKSVTHLLIIAGFALLSLLYCYPALQGKVLRQDDEVMWRAMAKEGMDWYEKTGENVLWSNTMFGGMPTYTYWVPESSNYIWKIQMFFEQVLNKPAAFLFVAMLCFYLLMTVLNVDKRLAVIGAVVYAFTYNPVIIAVGHNTKMVAIAYLPAVLAGLLLIYKQKWLSGAPLLAVSLALLISSSHYQVAYYAAIIIFFAVVCMLIIAIKSNQLKAWFLSSAVALVIAVIAVGPSLTLVFPTMEYTKETMRGGQSELTLNHDKGKTSGGLDKEYAFRWSNEIGETFCLMIPYLYGGSDQEPAEKAPITSERIGQQYERLPLYWGDQPMLAGPFYLGAVICFLFVLGLLVVENPHKWWIGAVCLLAILMSLGRNFDALNGFLFKYLPLFNKFRIPSMILIITQLLFPVLGFWGLQEIISKSTNKDALIKKLKIAAGITAGLCVLLGLGGELFFDFTDAKDSTRFPAELLPSLKEDRINLARNSSLLSAFYILVAAGLIWAFIKEKIKLNWLIGGFALLMVIDVFSTATRYLNDENYVDDTEYETSFQPRPVDLQIKQDTSYYRVLDLTRNVYNDAIQAYFHKSIGGYSPAKLEIYQDLIDVHMSSKFNSEVLNMLNTKYVIVQTGQQGGAGVIPNQTALGNAWFVNEVKLVNTADEEILSLNAPALGDTAEMQNAFSAAKTAVVRNKFANELKGYSFGKDSASRIVLTKYGLNDLTFRSENSRDGLAVFSDIYYPHGWKAFVDGKETPIIRANYVLRALKVPAGSHTIEFKFEPESYQRGDSIAMASSIIILLLCVSMLGIYFKKRNIKPGNQS